MGLIDSHAHLTDERLFGDLPGVLGRARAAGVDQIICVASDAADSRRAIELARANDGVFATVGIHPHQAANVADGDWSALEELLRTDGVVACGELGLDYHYDFADRQVQRDVLGRQLQTARTTDLPLVVHCREAFDDAISMLRDGGFEGRRVVFHCFSGTPDEAARVDDFGWRLSFTGLVTYKSAKQVRQVAQDYPGDRLMLETDSPYLSPVPKRGVSPNEPAHLIHTAQFLADLRKEPPEKLIERTSANTREFFRLVTS